MSAATPHPQAETSPVPSVVATLATLTALLLLTALTTALAFRGLGAGWHLVCALGIAALKAGLVAAVFMRLVRAPRLVRSFALAGVAWLLLLLAGVLSDLLTR